MSSNVPPSDKNSYPMQPMGGEEKKTSIKPEYITKLSKPIIDNIQSDKKWGLSQAMEDKGAVKGFALFIFYAIKLACGWTPTAYVRDERGGLTRAPISKDRDLARKLEKLNADAVDTFLNELCLRRATLQGQPERVKELDRMEKKAVELIIKPKYKALDSGQLDANGLIEKYQDVQKEKERLRLMKFEGFSSSVKKEGCDAEVDRLGFLQQKMEQAFVERAKKINDTDLLKHYRSKTTPEYFKKCIEAEFDRRVNAKYQALDGKISSEAKQAAKKLASLKEKKNDALSELARLPGEIKALPENRKKRLEAAIESDNEISTFREELEEKSRQLDEPSSNASKLRMEITALNLKIKGRIDVLEKEIDSAQKEVASVVRQLENINLQILEAEDVLAEETQKVIQELQAYANAVAFRKGLEMPIWIPGQSRVSEETKREVASELKKLALNIHNVDLFS